MVVRESLVVLGPHTCTGSLVQTSPWLFVHNTPTWPCMHTHAHVQAVVRERAPWPFLHPHGKALREGAPTDARLGSTWWFLDHAPARAGSWWLVRRPHGTRLRGLACTPMHTCRQWYSHGHSCTRMGKALLGHSWTMRQAGSSLLLRHLHGCSCTTCPCGLACTPMHTCRQ